MALSCGQLTTRVRIEQQTATVDSFGQRVETWTELASVWADFEAAGRTKIAATPGHEMTKLTPEQLDAWIELSTLMADEGFVASLRATTYMLRWTGVNRRAGSASHAAPLMRGPCGRCSPGQIVWWPASRVVGRQTFTIRIVSAPARPRKTFMQVILRAMRGASLCAAGGCKKGTHPVE